jgi:hypothetical protein
MIEMLTQMLSLFSLPGLDDGCLRGGRNNAARSTALNNGCAIYYPQLPALFLPGKEPK